MSAEQPASRAQQRASGVPPWAAKSPSDAELRRAVNGLLMALETARFGLDTVLAQGARPGSAHVDLALRVADRAIKRHREVVR